MQTVRNSDLHEGMATDYLSTLITTLVSASTLTQYFDRSPVTVTCSMDLQCMPLAVNPDLHESMFHANPKQVRRTYRDPEGGSAMKAFHPSQKSFVVDYHQIDTRDLAVLLHTTPPGMPCV